MSRFPRICRVPLLTWALLAFVFSLPATAQLRIEANANAGLSSSANLLNGVLTTTISPGGGASGGPTGPGVTSAVSDAFQTATLGNNPPVAARSDAHAAADLRTGIVRGSLLNTAIPGSGMTGIVTSRLGDYLYFTNTGTTPIVLPLTWTVEGQISANLSTGYGTLAYFYFSSINASIAAPVLQGTTATSHALYFVNNSGALTFYDQLSGRNYPLGAGPIWTITPLGLSGARMQGALVVPPGQSGISIGLYLDVDCRLGTSCDFATGTRGGAFSFGAFPPGLSMRSESGVFLGIVPPPPATSPGAPQNFQATGSGNTVDMSWSAPTTGSAPTSYTLIAKTPSGAPLATLPLGLVTSFSAAAPNGAYLLSVQATNAVGTGPESNTATVSLPSALQAPGPPSGLTASVAGTTVLFTWNAPSSGGTVATYVLVAGTTPGFTTPLATVPLPASPRSASFSGVPPGTYYVRMAAQNAAGTSAASPEIALAVAPVIAPATPTLNAPTVTGRTVALSWTPGGGGAPTSYLLVARSPGGALIASAPLSGTSASFPGVPSGTYVLTIAATNSAGTSPPSAQVTLVVP